MTDRRTLGPFELGPTRGHPAGGIYWDDCRRAGKLIPDRSVPLIFTDPPYAKAYLPLYKWLFEFGSRVLTPGGFLLTYVGHYWKDDIMEDARKHLEYYWDFPVISNGDAPMIWPRKIIARAKSILAYRLKGSSALPNTNVLGVYDSEKDKRFHKWGQSEVEARYYIDVFGPSDGPVLDPFLGGGSTAAAASYLGRPYLGWEILVENVRVSRARLRGEVPAPALPQQLALPETAA